MAESLKTKTLYGVFWVAIEKFALQIFAFVQQIILARLLMPRDFGLIAVSAVFFAISYCFIDSGFANALIRKKDRTNLDYSTVYVSNFILSIFFATLLSFVAPYIANFYQEPMLIKIIRVDALSMALGSLLAVQNTKMTINLDFRHISIINVSSTIASGISGIIFALNGYGVMSLVYPTFILLFVKAILMIYFQRWFPGIKFSKESFKDLFSYGSKLLVSNLIDVLFRNLNPIFIGKTYSSKQLGYYTKSEGFALLPSYVVTDILEKVSFPVLSKIQDDDYSLEQAYRRMIRLSAYILFPIMIGLSVLARPVVLLMITEKWENCIILLQILCFAYMFHPINRLNLSLLQVKGRSDLFLRLEVIKKIIGLIILLVTIPISLKCICYGFILSTFISMIINTYYTGKIINVGFFKQVKDILPSILYSLSMGVIIIFVTNFTTGLIMKLIIGTLAGVMYYFIISHLTNSKDLKYLIQLAKENIVRK
ncbi:MAG: lipopolysaccharide biosynthesis protein [Bacteroidales bacterium]|nr:lipopolysaccharide biosynthesis protein [Bacteroidales bacterium]